LPEFLAKNTIPKSLVLNTDGYQIGEFDFLFLGGRHRSNHHGNVQITWGQSISSDSSTEDLTALVIHVHYGATGSVRTHAICFGHNTHSAFQVSWNSLANPRMALTHSANAALSSALVKYFREDDQNDREEEREEGSDSLIVEELTKEITSLKRKVKSLTQAKAKKVKTEKEKRQAVKEEVKSLKKANKDLKKENKVLADQLLKEPDQQADHRGFLSPVPSARPAIAQPLPKTRSARGGRGTRGTSAQALQLTPENVDTAQLLARVAQLEAHEGLYQTRPRQGIPYRHPPMRQPPMQQAGYAPMECMHCGDSQPCYGHFPAASMYPHTVYGYH
jgi:hypothetical protein